MKEINVVCDINGLAHVTTKDLHISNEDQASKMIIDFSKITDHTEINKWVDLTLADGTSRRYDLGTSDIVELNLDADLTIPGPLTITPFIWSGLPPKIKFKPDKSVVIHYQAEAGEIGVTLRDDYIASLEARIKALEDIVLGG